MRTETELQITPTPRRRSHWRVALPVFAACIALFLLWPALDLQVSSLLQGDDGGFRWAREPLVLFSYELFKGRHIGWVLIALLVYVGISLWRGAPDRVRRRAALFLLAFIVAGPILLVNKGFKDHWGRARPYEITQFGGAYQYSPPLQPAAQCDSNCSFVSSHAAAGFALIGMYWITRRRRWLIAGIALGSAVGLGRMLQGAHFLSDIVFAFWAVYFSSALLAWLMLPAPPRDPLQDAATNPSPETA